MAAFVIAPHMRLHEWVARDKGYFDREGLDCEFRDQLGSPTGRMHDLGDKIGAYQTFERGRSADVSCTCHAPGARPRRVDAFALKPERQRLDHRAGEIILCRQQLDDADMPARLVDQRDIGEGAADINADPVRPSLLFPFARGPGPANIARSSGQTKRVVRREERWI